MQNQLIVDTLHLSLEPLAHRRWQIVGHNAGEDELSDILLRFTASSDAVVIPSEVELDILDPDETSEPAFVDLSILRAVEVVGLAVTITFFAEERFVSEQSRWPVTVPAQALPPKQSVADFRPKKAPAPPPPTTNTYIINGNFVQGTNVAGDQVQGNKTVNEESFNYKTQSIKPNDSIQGDHTQIVDGLTIGGVHTVATRKCFRGHPVGEKEKFCTECGARLEEESDGT